MPDPDLEIRGGRSPKILFLPLGPQFGLKNMSGGVGGGKTGHPGPSLDPPLQLLNRRNLRYP